MMDFHEIYKFENGVLYVAHEYSPIVDYINDKGCLVDFVEAYELEKDILELIEEFYN